MVTSEKASASGLSEDSLSVVISHRDETPRDAPPEKASYAGEGACPGLLTQCPHSSHRSCDTPPALVTLHLCALSAH